MVMVSSQVKMEGIARVSPFKRANFPSAVDETFGEDEPAEKRQRLDSVRLPEPQTSSPSHPTSCTFPLQPPPAAAAIRSCVRCACGATQKTHTTVFWIFAGLTLHHEPRIPDQRGRRRLH